MFTPRINSLGKSIKLSENVTVLITQHDEKDMIMRIGGKIELFQIECIYLYGKCANKMRGFKRSQRSISETFAIRVDGNQPRQQ